MLRKYFFVLFIFLILILIIAFVFRPDNIKQHDISGFEEQEKALRERYSSSHPEGKSYTKEELKSIENEVNELIKLKIEKERREAKKSSTNAKD